MECDNVPSIMMHPLSNIKVTLLNVVIAGLFMSLHILEDVGPTPTLKPQMDRCPEKITSFKKKNDCLVHLEKPICVNSLHFFYLERISTLHPWGSVFIKQQHLQLSLLRDWNFGCLHVHWVERFQQPAATLSQWATAPSRCVPFWHAHCARISRRPANVTSPDMSIVLLLVVVVHLVVQRGCYPDDLCCYYNSLRSSSDFPFGKVFLWTRPRNCIRLDEIKRNHKENNLQVKIIRMNLCLPSQTYLSDAALHHLKTLQLTSRTNLEAPSFPAVVVWVIVSETSFGLD